HLAPTGAGRPGARCSGPSVTEVKAAMASAGSALSTSLNPSYSADAAGGRWLSIDRETAPVVGGSMSHRVAMGNSANGLAVAVVTARRTCSCCRGERPYPGRDTD